jgi:hypothetical protein
MRGLPDFSIRPRSIELFQTCLSTQHNLRPPTSIMIDPISFSTSRYNDFFSLFQSMHNIAFVLLIQLARGNKQIHGMPLFLTNKSFPDQMKRFFSSLQRLGQFLRFFRVGFDSRRFSQPVRTEGIKCRSGSDRCFGVDRQST